MASTLDKQIDTIMTAYDAAFKQILIEEDGVEEAQQRLDDLDELRARLKDKRGQNGDIVPEAVTEIGGERAGRLAELLDLTELTEKYNTQHDELGRFTFSSGGGAGATGKFSGVDSTESWKQRTMQEDTRFSEGERTPEERMSAKAAEMGMTLDEYKEAYDAHLIEQLEGTEVAVRMDARTLSSVLKDDKIKNQYESGRSKGLKEPEIRENFEDDVFGDIYANMGERPIYGYIFKQGASEEPGQFWLDQYGQTRVVLNQSVRDRSTMTVGDSLDINTAGRFPAASPMPINSPDWRASAHTGRSDLAFSHADRPSPRYWEAQIHGGVQASDIARVDFLAGSKPSKAVRGKLDKAGISFTVADDAFEDVE
jgi:hypothetical protein